MISEWLLKETNQRRLKENMPEVAVIPTSAIEPHNLHLPIGQDFMHTGYIVEQSAKIAWDRTKKVIALPGIPYGVDCNLLDFPIAIHVSQDVLNAMLREVIWSLRSYGIRKIVIVNGHGGNDFTPFIRQIQSNIDVYIFQMDWWKVGDDKYFDVFEKPEDHAGEMETSVGLALYPHLVEMEYAKDGKAREFRIKALQKGWAGTSRDFSKLNDHCATADPYAGTAEKGEKYLNIVIERIAEFLTDLANEPVDDIFPYKE
ncbi:MAG: creatininase family protein [Chlorobi bacterium]|nr:creatininase family protein [Chlorobiota bacterium]